MLQSLLVVHFDVETRVSLQRFASPAWLRACERTLAARGGALCAGKGHPSPHLYISWGFDYNFIKHIEFQNHIEFHPSGKVFLLNTIQGFF